MECELARRCLASCWSRCPSGLLHLAQHHEALINSPIDFLFEKLRTLAATDTERKLGPLLGLRDAIDAYEGALRYECERELVERFDEFAVERDEGVEPTLARANVGAALHTALAWFWSEEPVAIGASHEPEPFWVAETEPHPELPGAGEGDDAPAVENPPMCSQALSRTARAMKGFVNGMAKTHGSKLGTWSEDARRALADLRGDTDDRIDEPASERPTGKRRSALRVPAKHVEWSYRSLVATKHVLRFGGTPREEARRNIQESLGIGELSWPDSDRPRQLSALIEGIARFDIVLVTGR